MTSRRTARAARAIQETVSSTILFDLKDPRVKNVTVLSAEVSPDLRNAKVYVSVMGEPREQRLTMHGLESARGFIQSKVADRLQTRYTPVLKFVLDQGVKRSAEASRILREAIPPAGDEVEVPEDHGFDEEDHEFDEWDEPEDDEQPGAE